MIDRSLVTDATPTLDHLGSEPHQAIDQIVHTRSLPLVSHTHQTSHLAVVVVADTDFPSRRIHPVVEFLAVGSSLAFAIASVLPGLGLEPGLELEPSSLGPSSPYS